MMCLRFRWFSLVLLIALPCVSEAGVTASIGSALDQCLTYEETDGSPSAQACEKLLMPNGSLTDNSNGTFTFTSSGSGTVTSIAQGTNMSFSVDPITTTGTVNLTASPSVTNLTASGTVTGLVVSGTSALQVGADYITDITGTNLSVVGGKLTAAGGSGNSFETIAVPAGASVVADSSTDTLTITETSFLTITGTAATDTIDITQITTDLGTDGLIAADAVALGTDTTGAYVAGITGGAGITSSGGGAENATVTLTTDSTEAAFLAAGALTCGAATAGKMQIHTTPLQYCDNAATPALQYAAYGSNAGVATSAAAFTGNYVASVATTSPLAGGAAASNAAALTLSIGDVALGSGTSGNYVSSATASQGLLITGTEGASVGLDDCAANQIWKRNAGDTAWACAADADSGGSTAWDAIGDPTTSADVAFAGLSETISGNTNDVTAVAQDALAINFTNDAATDILTQRLLVLNNVSATGGTTETMLAIDNQDNSAVTTGILIVGSSTGAITTAIDASDAEIGTALAIGANTITVTDGALINLSGITVNTTTEGLQLPTWNSAGTAEGQISWDATNNELYVGDAATQVKVGKFVVSGSTITSLATYFEVQMGGGSEVGVIGAPMPFAATCKNLYVAVSVAPDNGAGTQTWTAYVDKDGVNTALTCVISETAKTCSDTTNSVAFTAGNAIKVEFNPASTPLAEDDAAWSMECYPD